MTDDVECTIQPYRPNGTNRPRQRVTPYAAKVKDEGAEPAGFKPVDAFCGEYMPISYAVEPFVRSGSLYTLTARTGAGKTALLVTMALAVATGRGDKILGREVTKGRVAFIAVENPTTSGCGSWSQRSS
jgi:hypothetical protein